MSLRKSIFQILQGSKKEMSMSEIYAALPTAKKHTIRARVYEQLGKGITRVNKNLYISSEAIVEQGNALKIIDRLIEEGDKFETIFLDIPYDGGSGQKGGNRNLFDCEKISPEQFEIFIDKCSQLLLTDTSPLLFMFTSGKSSKSQHDKYMSKIKLKRCNVMGVYQKLWPNGKPMNFGKHLMPVERIYVFSKSGKLDSNIQIPNMSFRMVPDMEYPTSKPYEMIKTLISVFSKPAQWIFDPFGGSGKTLKACLELKRKCHIIDISEISINNHLIPLLQ